jgi:nicotinate phosphoribosyltransferase
LLEATLNDRDAAHLLPGIEDMAGYTDLYEIAMAAGYFAQGMTGRATFELAVRNLPAERSFLVCAGLEQALRYLERARFSADTLRYLRAHPALKHIGRPFWRRLAEFRFTGDVWAMPEGSLAFAGEPLLYVRAPLIEAQLVETYLLATITAQTAVASKAARIVNAAKMHPVIEFGARRAHGPQAGLLAARACHIAGCAATSNVLAGQRLGIPTTGTQAHSWIMAFASEEEAFRKYLQLFPRSTTLLIDTYDTPRGAEIAARRGPRVKALRIDSGDLAALSRRVRDILDAAGLEQVRIIASGDLDEYRIADLLRRHSPIDAFGVGTEMVTSRDDPALSCVYKLVEIEERGVARPVSKQSPGKETLPGLKQVWRYEDYLGKFRRDRLCPASERAPGEPMLTQVMRGGRLIAPLPPLTAIRQYCREQINRLSLPMRALDGRAAYDVRISESLRRAADAARPPSSQQVTR